MHGVKSRLNLFMLSLTSKHRNQETDSTVEKKYIAEIYYVQSFWVCVILVNSFTVKLKSRVAKS